MQDNKKSYDKASQDPNHLFEFHPVENIYSFNLQNSSSIVIYKYIDA